MKPHMRNREGVTIRVNKFALMLLLFVPAIIGIVALVVTGGGTISSTASALAAAALVVILVLSVSIILR